MKNKLILTLVLLQALIYAQNKPQEQVISCGFDMLPHTHKQTNASFEKKYQQRITSNINAKSNTERIIPIVFHVFHVGENLGTGSNMSDSQIKEALSNLNNLFSNTEGSIHSTDTKIKFVLANKIEGGIYKNGIERIDMSNNIEFVNNGTRMYNSQPGVSFETLADLSRWDNRIYYNVYVVPFIQGATGYAAMPTDGGAHYYDRTVMRAEVLNYGVFAHEIGHALNLYHTFEGSTGADCPVQSNGCGSGLGDCVADTPPHIKNHMPDEKINEYNACANNNDSSFKTNAMTYNIANYMKNFTPLQALRMQTAFDDLRQNFHKENNDFLNSKIKPEADFLIDDEVKDAVYLCANNEIKLTNTSKHFLNTYQENSSVLNYTSTWEIIKDGITVQTVNTTNPTINFTTNGVYSIKLTVTTPGGIHTKTLNNVVHVVNTQEIPYCTKIRSMNPGPWGSSISEVKIGGITNTTRNGFNEYADFTCSKVAVVSASETANLNLKITVSKFQKDNHHYKAFIDYNRDGLFTEDEVLGFGEVVPDSNNKPITITFKVPSSLDLTKIYRLRIVADAKPITSYNCNIYQEIFYNMGDVEDYSIMFKSNDNLSNTFVKNNIFSIYPNPTEGVINISASYEKIALIELYDLRGRLLLKKNNLNDFIQNVDISKYQSGAYILKVNQSSYKIIKK